MSMASFGRLSRHFTILLRSVGVGAAQHYRVQNSNAFARLYQDNTFPTLSGNHLVRLSSSQATISKRRSLKSEDDNPGKLSVDGQLEALDAQVRRYGRVNKQQVLQILEQIKKTGKVSEQNSVMLLRCTGSLLRHDTEESRMNVFKQVWTTLNDLGAITNISHYNAALRVKIENNDQVSPTDFLTELESKRILPNRITYQLLIARYCEEGDVEGATKILEHMKSQQMPINETIFNALVKGYCKKGQFDSAKEVLKSMKVAGLEPSADSFRVLACAYAGLGDMPNVLQTIEEAAKGDSVLQSRQLMDIIVELASSGHKDFVPQVLNMITGKKSFIEVQNAISTLLSRGHTDVAFQVFAALDSVDVNTDDSKPRAFVRSMVEANVSLPNMLEVMNQMSDRGHGTVDLGMVLYFAHQNSNADLALQVLQEMKKRDQEVKAHFFWKIYRHYRDEHNIEGLYRIMMVTIQMLTDDKECLGTLNREGVTPLVQLGEPLDKVLAKLKEFGLSPELCNSLGLVQQLEIGQYEAALKTVSEGHINYSPLILKAVLPGGFKANPDAKLFTDVLVKLRDEIDGDRVFLHSGVLLGIAAMRLPKELLEQLIESVSAKELLLDKTMEQNLVRAFRNCGVSEDHIKKLESLMIVPKEARIPLVKAKELREKKIEELEQVKESYNSRGVRDGLLDKLMLNKYCQLGKVKEADALKAKLDQRGFLYGADSLRQLAYLEAKYKENLAEALTYKETLETQHPEFYSYINVNLQIALLQIKKNKIQDALETLKSYMTRHGSKIDKNVFAEGFILSDVCMAMVDACIEQGTEPDTVKHLVQTLFDLGYIKKGTFSLLQAVVKSYLHKENFDGAVRTTEEFVAVYGRAPMFSDLLAALIKKEDSVRLQKVVDLLISLQGDMQVLHHLVIGFVDCGKIKQARKILDTPGIRAINSILKNAAESFIAHDKVKELENLTVVTKGLFALDRDEMLFSLMRVYAKEGDTSKCLDVLTTFEDEGVMPRGRTLRYLAKVLESKGLPVPFQVPSAAEDLTGTHRPAVNPLEEEAWKAIDGKDFNKVMEIKKQIEEKGDSLSTTFLSGLADNLLKTRQTYIFKRLVHELGQDGDVDSLLHIRQHNLPANMDNYIHQRLFRAYILSGRVEEIMDFLLESPALLPKYSTTGGVQLLAEKYPTHVAKFEAVLDKYMAESSSVPQTDVANHLFNFYLASGQFDKAQGLLQKFPKFRNRANLSFVTKEIDVDKREAVLLKLLVWFRDIRDPKPKLAYIYSGLITVQNELGSWQDALSYYEQARGEGLELTDLWARPMLQLETQLEASGQALPWKKGAIQEKATKQEIAYDDDAASGSSSDEEPVRARKFKKRYSATHSGKDQHWPAAKH